MHDARSCIESHLSEVVYDQQIQVVEHKLLADFS